MIADRTLPDDARSRRDVGPNAVLGDGSMLVTLSRRGEVEQLWWPHVDRDPQLVELRLLVHDDGGVATWLDDPTLAHTQWYEDDADVLRTEVRGDVVGEVVVTDLVTVDGPVLVRHLNGLRGRLGVHLRPAIGGTVRAGGAYVDPVSGVLVCHRRDRVLAVGLDVPSTGHVAERHRGHGADEALLGGRPAGGGIVHGEVDGALLGDVPADAVTVVVACASTRDGAVGAVVATLAAGAERVAEARRVRDRQRLASLPGPLLAGPEARLYRRSILTFDALRDRATGGMIAAPEADPDFVRSGGYGFVWARDLAFVLLAATTAGLDDVLDPALGWLLRAQGPDGLWAQRHWTDGTIAPTWGTQLDETGAVLVAYGAAVASRPSAGLQERLWPSARRAADALVRTLDPTTGLPAPSMDLWEERVGLHAYTAAATWAGLRAAADLAGTRSEHELAAVWRSAADRVRAGIDEHLWSEEHGRYLRSIQVARGDADGVPTPAVYDLLDHPAAHVASVDEVDEVVDASLLGLTYPFGVLPADDPRMAATLAAVSDRLTAPDGGLRRYEGDPYIGGNPWVLTTLWLGLARRAPGADVPADGVGYAIRAATSAGLLPEQVDAATGRPAWIVPLAWSHAMLILALRPDPASIRTATDARHSTRVRGAVATVAAPSPTGVPWTTSGPSSSASSPTSTPSR